jgi:hypothetical protein
MLTWNGLENLFVSTEAQLQHVKEEIKERGRERFCLLRFFSSVYLPTSQ